MSSLQSVVEALVREGEAFVIDAPEAWSQGRTLYGGMTAALAFEAVKRAHGDPSEGDMGPLRSAQFAFIGPASGRLAFTSTLLRRGRSSVVVAADCLNEGGVAARALFVFGGARESKIAHDHLPMPKVVSPEEGRGFRKEGEGAPRGFWNNFESRLVAGGRMLETSAPKPEFTVWTRYREAGAVDPVTALLAIADCLPPAAAVHFPQFGPISTMTWSVDIMATPARADGWKLLQSSSEHAADGYSMQRMMIWDEDGAPLAVGRQAVAIFV